MKKQIQKGFTLIELMIVVAIIAILAAIAIPQYQNYVARSQVSRVMGETSAVKTAIEDCLINGKGASDCFIGWTTSNLVAASGTSSTTNDATAADTKQKGLAITNYAKAEDAATKEVAVTATFGQNAASAINGKKLAWTRSTAGSWTCKTDVDAKFRSTGCAAGTF
ncbi:MAG: pilin [Cardiobacteriaceae bacterium]|nr:pilin [Cardiobacteriaceae bacterium]